jgi:hypothetical protein
LTGELSKYRKGKALPDAIRSKQRCSGSLKAIPAGVSDAQIVMFEYSAAPLKKCLHTKPGLPESSRATRSSKSVKYGWAMNAL